MKKSLRTVRLNEYGISLVEVITSIVILFIILISIFTLLTQSAKTTKNSENIFNATYIAQSEIEKTYEAVKSYNFTAPYCKNAILNIDKNEQANFKYTLISENNCSLTFEKYHQQTNNYIILEIAPKTSYSYISSILIKVYEKKEDTRPKAQMQSTLEWMAEHNENK
ncbi:hypothetical protein [Lysinibacillus sp. SGAir0095]|uniref:hypothetical protein n=1 Tax=Lysinibacillus sp. SGAir0095 TaxID=2070463 RepID=UPI0010CCEA47|nr:hypothetical protein [Lysinibacillus sp. SGAir0095]QCR32035.1 hypothetical protein C1N55_07560 [Lysinibacillus sp. SGAir0095]